MVKNATIDNINLKKKSWIIKKINESPLGCFLHSVADDYLFDPSARKLYRNRQELIFPAIVGTTKTGRAVFIELFKDFKDNKRTNKTSYPLMRKMFTHNAVVGCAVDFYDVWDIILGEEIKRKRETWLFLGREYIPELKTEPELIVNPKDEFEEKVNELKERINYARKANKSDKEERTRAYIGGGVSRDTVTRDGDSADCAGKDGTAPPHETR